MNRKEYTLIAKIFSDFLDDGDNDQLDGIGGAEKLARTMADKLEETYKNFDRVKFMEAMKLI